MGLSEMRRLITGLTLEFADVSLADRNFIAGETPIPVSGKVLDSTDLAALVDSCLDGWLTAGVHTEEFESALSSFVGVRSALMVNSGSSANLLAMSALTSPSLGERALSPGDEVVTAAVGFPTTVNPIIQNRLRPVLVDIELGTYNASVDQIESAIGPKTKAVAIAHTLGNPFEVGRVRELCDEHGLWLIEDNCDALGAIHDGKRTGSFGDLATLSFYPAHHITTGEGGAVLTRSPRLRRLVESFRDWGRDCYCAPGRDNTCNRRFEWQLGDLPYGYDHKYIYSHVGYNLKATDMQAALGVSQLSKIERFIELRRRNFDRLYEGLAPFPELLMPQATPQSSPSWFGFPITIRPDSGVDRRELLRFLDSRKIGSRLLFGGNLRRQPAYRNVDYRVAGELENSDLVTEHSFWIGTYPGLTNEMLDFTVESVAEFLSNS